MLPTHPRIALRMVEDRYSHIARPSEFEVDGFRPKPTFIQNLRSIFGGK